MISGAFLCDNLYNPQVLLNTKASRVIDSGGTDRILKANVEWGSDSSLELSWNPTTAQTSLFNYIKLGLKNAVVS
jgi:hypothetical protein